MKKGISWLDPELHGKINSNVRKKYSLVNKRRGEKEVTRHIY